MKLLIIFLMTILSVNTFAFEKDFFVLERKPFKKKVYRLKRTLKDFTSKTQFDGKYFKVVQGKSNKPISFNADKELVKRAANVYYHLSKARSYWVNIVQSKFVANIPKTTVRIDIDAVYSKVGHFAHANSEKEYNNALTVEGGQTPALLGNQDTWGDEIWFRPKKVINTKELSLANNGSNPVTSTLEGLQDPVLNFAENRLEQETIKALFYERYNGPYWQSLAWSVGTFAIMKVLIEGSKKLDRLFMEKYFYLDTALLPEVIYHEYTHLALSDHLKMSHSTAVVEGLADYFASKIAEQTKMYNKIKGVSSSFTKDAKSKAQYRYYFEHNRFARSDFVFSVLYDVNKAFPATAERLIYESRKSLDTYDATIHDSLLRSLLIGCDAKCVRPYRDRLKLFKVFENRGF